MLIIAMIFAYSQLSNDLTYSSRTRWPLEFVDTLKIYRLALVKIESEKKFKEFPAAGYSVSEEKLSFKSLSWFFKDELSSLLGNTEFGMLENKVVGTSKSLIKLGRRKHSEEKIFFSEINSKIFFAEVLRYKGKSSKYTDRPHFGKSLAYMFRIEEGSVELISVKEIAYN